MVRRLAHFFALLFALCLVAKAASAAPAQGVGVIGVGEARTEAFLLARAVYASQLRPRSLNELQARILAGDPAPAGTTKEVHDLAELRSSISGEDDAPTRQLLTGIAHQTGVQALLVLKKAGGDNAAVSAKLFLPDSGEFDAAKYEPDPNAPDAPWAGTVKSLEPRFPPPPPPPKPPPAQPFKPTPEPKESRPFYTSPWFWGAIGAAALVGAIFLFTTQDTSSDPIHLQMRIPR